MFSFASFYVLLRLYAMESQKTYFRNEVSRINDRMKELKNMYFQRMKTDMKCKNALPPVVSSKHGDTLAGKVDTIASHSVQEFQDEAQSLQNQSNKTDKGDKNIITSANLDIATIKSVFKRYSDEQDEIQHNIELRKSQFMENSRRNSLISIKKRGSAQSDTRSRKGS